MGDCLASPAAEAYAQLFVLHRHFTFDLWFGAEFREICCFFVVHKSVFDLPFVDDRCFLGRDENQLRV